MTQLSQTEAFRSHTVHKLRKRPMKKAHRRHTQAFKAKAVIMTREDGVSFVQVGKHLGIHPNMIHAWANNFKVQGIDPAMLITLPLPSLATKAPFYKTKQSTSQVGRIHRTHSDKFKAKAVVMSTTGEYTQGEVALSLGIAPGLLCKWKRRFKDDGIDPASLLKTKPKQTGRGSGVGYSQEFKAKALCSIANREMTFTETSRSLGIHVSSLYNWKKQFKAEGINPADLIPPPEAEPEQVEPVPVEAAPELLDIEPVKEDTEPILYQTLELTEKEPTPDKTIDLFDDAVRLKFELLAKEAGHLERENNILKKENVRLQKESTVYKKAAQLFLSMDSE